MVGNKLFGMAFSYLLDQGIKDTLCGTKVLCWTWAPGRGCTLTAAQD